MPFNNFAIYNYLKLEASASSGRAGPRFWAFCPERFILGSSFLDVSWAVLFLVLSVLSSFLDTRFWAFPGFLFLVPGVLVPDVLVLNVAGTRSSES